MRWTPDCQGKWDYDGRVLTVSTRYWPAGGGFHVMNSADGRGLVPSAELYPAIKPSATAAIHFEYGEPDDNGYNNPYLILAEQDFKGETEAEVKAAVEAWVREQFTDIFKLAVAHFGTPKEP